MSKKQNMAIHNPARQANMEECTCEMKAFVAGGRPGLARLKLVVGSLFKQFQIVDSQDRYTVLYNAGVPIGLLEQMVQTALLPTIRKKKMSSSSGLFKSNNSTKKQKVCSAKAECSTIDSYFTKKTACSDCEDYPYLMCDS